MVGFLREVLQKLFVLSNFTCISGKPIMLSIIGLHKLMSQLTFQACSQMCFFYFGSMGGIFYLELKQCARYNFCGNI